jgi:hypothetical protein
MQSHFAQLRNMRPISVGSITSITEHSFHGITSSPKKGGKCNPCVRYVRVVFVRAMMRLT